MIRRHERGFTLIELMLVLALIGILVRMSLNYGGVLNRDSKLSEIAKGVSTAAGYARAQGLATGNNTMMTIDGNQAVAFVDIDGDHAYTSGTDTLIYRYPPGATLLASGFSITGQALQELQTGPNTAVYDRRGFYVDSFYNVPRHDAEVCITDTVTQHQKIVFLGRFGTVEIMQQACGLTSASCSTSNLPTTVHR